MKKRMRPEPFAIHDIDSLLNLARAEGWVTEQRELEFLVRTFPQGCFCLRDDRGRAAGFVTSLRHDRSGWIGNLIVRPDLRGTGKGRDLLRSALTALDEAGCRTVWLTASVMGRPLYERHGFRAVDDVVRRVRPAGRPIASAGPGDRGSFGEKLDALCWGDRRKRLLAWAGRQGETISEGGSCAILRDLGASFQLGPWSARDRDSARRVLATALNRVPEERELICDTPLSNRSCAELMEEGGFAVRGRTLLMWRGIRPDYRPELLYALATLGSSG